MESWRSWGIAIFICVTILLKRSTYSSVRQRPNFWMMLFTEGHLVISGTLSKILVWLILEYCMLTPRVIALESIL